MALFLPAAALVPVGLFAVGFKGGETVTKYLEATGVACRPSEAAEFYLYFFMLAYLIVFGRRIRGIETEASGFKTKKT